MTKRMFSLFLAILMVFGMIPAGVLSVSAQEAEEEPQPITIDFKEFAKEAAEQDWYDDLVTVQTINGYDTKRASGPTRGTGMSGPEKEAYYKMLDWMEETQIWSIDDDASKFTVGDGNRLYLCPDDNIEWGLGHNTWYRGTDSKTVLAMTVTAPKTGRYNMSMENVHVSSSSKDVPFDGWDGNYGYIDIYVNDKLISKEYKNAGSGVFDVDLGTVSLNEGENSIRFYAVDNYVHNGNATPCWNFNLKSLTFEPLEAEVVNINFKQFAKEAAQQDWYNDLATVQTISGVDTKRASGKTRGQGMSATESAAFDAMMDWMAETQNFTFDLTKSNFKGSGGNRLYLCPDDSIDWGIGHNTYYRGSGSDHSLSINVEIPVEGRYNVDMITSHVSKSSKDVPFDGWDGNFGYTDIYVNGELFVKEYNNSGSGKQSVALGAVPMKEGTNNITFCGVKNYVGNTNATPCWNFNLCDLTFTSMTAVKVNEEAKTTVRLQGGYLPLDAVVTPDTYEVAAEDEDLVQASITEDGLLLVYGLNAGQTKIFIYQNGEEVGTVPVKILKADYSAMAPVVVDFKEFARQAQQQSFWSDLHMAANEDTVYIGRVMNNDVIPDSEIAAYEQMIKWGKETFGWTIDEGLSGFTSYWKRLYFNGQDTCPWGFSMYTYYHAASLPDRSKLALTVTAPSDGWYEIDMTVFKENSSWAGIGSTIGDNSGGDIIAVYVNGQQVLTNYSLIDNNFSVTEDIGSCYLKEGENSVIIDSVLSYNTLGTGGRSNVPVREMIFTPLTGVEVQEYLSEVITLNETYLPFSADLSGITVETTNDLIAEAAVNASGVVTVKGLTKGEAKIYVKQAGEILCIIPVTVTGFEGTLDELQGNPARVDFMAFADRAAEQDWWEGDNMLVDAANEDVTGWLGRNTRWNLTSGQMTVADKANYGIAVDDAAMSVDIPAEGLYNMNVEYLAGGGCVDVAVNGESVYEALDTAGEAAVVKASLGAVELTKGENTMAFAGDGAYLRAVTFTPLGVCQTEVGGEQYLVLNDTYLAFDEDASNYTVSISGDVASAVCEDGIVTVTGEAVGEAVLTLSGDKSFAVAVKVVEKSDVSRVIYTVDGFKAETMPVGAAAEGNVTGLTGNNTRLAEQYLCAYGDVYYLSSNSAVAKVDNATGNITAVSEGVAVVTVYVQLDGKIVKDSVQIVVTDDTDLESIEVAANVSYVATGNNLQLTVSGLKTSGAAADMSKFPITWSLDDDTVVSIDETGMLTGLAEGTVTVTATAGVMGMPISDTIELQVIDNALLPTKDVILQLDEANVLYWDELDLYEDGFCLNKEKTYKEGTEIQNDAQGPRLNVPAGGAMAFDFVVKQSGWYQAYTQGKSLVNGGGLCYVYVDGDYVGFMDGAASNSNSDAGGKMDTIWMDAGVHTIEVVATKSCWIMVGRAIFYPTSDPRAVEVELSTKKSNLIYGESTEAVLTMYDQNKEKWHLLQQDAQPGFTNWFKLESSDPSIVKVSGTTLTATGVGTATITMTGEACGERVTATTTVVVEHGSYAEAKLSAERTTLLPDAEDFPLTLTTYNADGTEQPAVPDRVSVSYSSNDEEILTVSADGIVSLKGKTGSALVTATMTEEGRTTETSIWISVNAAKTEPTVYTYQKRANAQENVNKYAWAWSMKESAVVKADYYVEHLDQIYDLWIPNTFPRTSQVGFRSDPNYRYCRYCGVDLVANYHAYPWIVDPLEKPWKIQCPACLRDFPSNDFESYYKSGLGEDGKFHKELADPQYLVNELYPEMGEGWGVDDGFGFVTYNAAGATECHTYISYFLCCATVGLSGRVSATPHSMSDIFTALMDAYLYTGDEKYGSAGAILVDRLADIYPEMEFFSSFDWKSYAFVCALSGRGKFIGLTWDGILSITFSKAVDAFWPAAENEDVIEYLRNRAPSQGKNPEDITPEYLRTRAEDNILMEIYRSAENGNIQGNFGMSEAAVAYAAHTLNRLPESKEMVEWVFATEKFSGAMPNYHVAGGDVSRVLVDWFNRDGLAFEGSLTYNAIMEGYLIDLADALDGFDLVPGYDLWKNQKMVNLYTGMTRLTVGGHLSPQIHEGGGPQSSFYLPNIDRMNTAFSKSGYYKIAQALYNANGNSTKGLHADIFTKNPEEGIRTAIQDVIDKYGTWDLSDSDMLSGFGIAILRDGPHDYLGTNVNADEFSDFWMGFGYTDISHAIEECLAIDLHYRGLNLSSAMGYPAVVQASDPMRMQWVGNAISHNTVVVNDQNQTPTDEAGFPQHFEDAGYAKVMDVAYNKAYDETDIYRRTVVAVDNQQGEHYAVDFFRVLGGSEHVYSFHGMSDVDATTTGLEFVHQAMGTYEGPESPYGDGQKEGINFSSGYTWLDDVYRDADPETTFTVDWAIKDFNKRLTTSSGIHLKLHMMSEEPMTEVALANGYPPKRIENKNVPHMEYMLVRRSGTDGMDTLFTTVIEPYQHQSYVETTELADVVLVEGTEEINDRAAAIKVTLKSGRVDYIVYATNPNCLYRVADKFDFMGSTGVVSYTDGLITYAWGSEATVVADVIEDADASVTGTVTDFTKDITMDGYSITVQMDDPVSAEELTDRYIYVETDGIENGVYRIYGAEIKGNTAVLDLDSQTLVREYQDKFDFSKGYKYNISEGARYIIPLSAAFDVTGVLTYTADQVIKAGSRLSLQVGVSGSGAAYEAEGMPKGMKIDAVSGTLTWTTSKTQTGRYPITVKAIDADGTDLGSVSFVIYVVSYSGSAYTADVCAHAKAVTYTVDDVIETVCPACGTITRTAIDEEEKFVVAGSNMTLGNELAVNFLVKATDYKDGQYAVIDHNGETTEVELVKYNSAYYAATCKVAAKELADTLAVTIMNAEGKAVSEVYEGSARSYAMKVLGMSTMSQEMKTMVVDMLNYGTEAQTFFGYNEEDLANSLLTDSQKALATESVTCVNRQVKGTNFVGSNLSLEDKIVLNMMFKGEAANGMYAEITYTDYQGSAQTVKVEKADFGTYGPYIKIVVDEIVLADAYQLVTVTLYNADHSVYGSGSDSVESYAKRTGDTLATAMMKFATSAIAYLSK